MSANELPPEEDLFTRLNRQTARIQWKELERFYAQGATLVVAPGVDLVAVAQAVAEDDKDRVKAWMDAKQFGPVGDEQAKLWFESDAELWAVVVAPWVLVQGEAAN